MKRTLAICAVFVIVLMAVGMESAGAARLYPCPQFGAHCGQGWPTPNSQDGVKAIAAAISNPAVSLVESDVRSTADGQAIMQHDDNLAVATTSTGLISRRTYADIRANVRMKDGTVPQSLHEFLTQVTGHKHAILHVKSTSLVPFIAAQLRAVAGARTYVRVVFTSATALRDLQTRLPGYFFEYMTSAAARPWQVADAKKWGWRVMVVPYQLSTAAPADWFQPFVTGRVPIDYTTYNAAQDVQAKRWPFGRVLTGNVAATRAATGCPA